MEEIALGCALAQLRNSSRKNGTTGWTVAISCQGWTGFQQLILVELLTGGDRCLGNQLCPTHTSGMSSSEPIISARFRSLLPHQHLESSPALGKN